MNYGDLLLDRYISAIEVVNPMHSLWSDGRWNKLTMAMDVTGANVHSVIFSLDYIKIYEPIAASLLCDRIGKTIIAPNREQMVFILWMKLSTTC